MDLKVGSLISDRYERLMRLGLLESVPPFEVELKMAYARHRSPMQIDLKIMTEHVLHLGLCLPKSCGNEEIQSLLQVTLDEMDLMQELEMQPEVYNVKDLKLRREFFYRKSLWMLLAYVAVIAVMTRCASIYRNESKAEFDKKETSLLSELVKCFNSEENKKKIRSRESSADAINSIAGLK